MPVPRTPNLGKTPHEPGADLLESFLALRLTIQLLERGDPSDAQISLDLIDRIADRSITAIDRLLAEPD